MRTNEYSLPSKSRHYKESGKKLAPRDSYEAMLQSRVPGMHSYKARRKSDAIEVKAYGDPKQFKSRSELRVDRMKGRLSTRRAAFVERVFECSVTTDDGVDSVIRAAYAGHLTLGNAQLAYLHALADSFYSELAQQADEHLRGLAA